ncbi:MAG: hypothetical protein HKN46_08470, partial [Acidimicrobiia bacterium]|nr:hypothetical protein [Acidimicrobiia bacterium]
AAPPATQAQVESLESFIGAFSAALEAGDVEFVWERLHPEVIAVSDEATCRAWVEAEVMGLSGYTFIEETAGPVTVQGIADVYVATVGFDFGGQRFEDQLGQFALLAGEWRWLGQCR